MDEAVDRKSVLAAVGFSAAVAIVVMHWLASGGAVQADKATHDQFLTAEQCIDNNSTNGSVEPFEDALVQEGVVNADLDKTRITHRMCEEIIMRTTGGLPISSAAALGNLTQELRIIKKSMEDASDKDVNGDGTVNAEDEGIANSASLAAARAAQQTVRKATEESSTDGRVIKELKAELAAYLAQERTTPYSSEQTTPYSGEQTTATTGEETTYYYSASANASASASASAAQDQPKDSLYDKTQKNASGAAHEKGASQQAGDAGGHCAATVAFIDSAGRKISQRVAMGNRTFDAPAKQIHWRDKDIAQLSVAPKDLVSIEKLKRSLDQTEGAGTHCMKLGSIMEAQFIPSDNGLDITSLSKPPKKDVSGNTSTTWRWIIEASKPGEHLLALNLRGYVHTPSMGGRLRSFEQNPPLFNDYIYVGATRWELATAFATDHSLELVPIFLTILTAILIPFVILPWWRRRHQPRDPRDTSSAPRDDRWI